jgi:uncharacterized protein (DUF1697 family)
MTENARAKPRTKTRPVTYAALLRSVNVGGNNPIAMAKLKATFERLGFAGVRTFIASGNVIFRTGETDEARLVRKIEAAIEADFRVKIKVLLRDVRAMGKLVRTISPAWVNDKQMRCDVMFLWKEIDSRSVLKELPINPALEDVKYVPGAVLWRIDRDKVTRSRMSRIIGTKLYQQITVRNLNTVRKLYARMLEEQ